MSRPDKRPGDTASDEQPTETEFDRPPVHVDNKGRLSVSAVDLARSETFRTELGRMVELAEKHPPKAASLP